MEKERKDTLSMSAGIPDPTLLRALAENFVYHIERGVSDYYQLSKKVIEEFGEKVRPFLYEAWQRAHELMSVDIKPKQFISDEQYSKNFRYMKESLFGKQYREADPELLKDLVIVAKYKIEQGTKDFYQYSLDMIKEFGEKIRPYLHESWTTAQEEIKIIDTLTEEAKSK